MAFAVGDKTERTLAEINVTPLVDVMLVLLIIFMITAPMIQRGVDIAVPKTKHGNVIPEERLILSITKENEIRAEGQPGQVGLDSVADVINNWFAKRPVADDERTVYVRADGEVAYQTLMLVIDQAKEAGVRNVGLVTDPKTAADEKAAGDKKEGEKAP